MTLLKNEIMLTTSGLMDLGCTPTEDVELVTHMMLNAGDIVW